jgi:hypothetical protein
MQNKLKTRGILMLVAFAIILTVIFSPVFPGKVNGLDYMDNLFNMVSKGSSYFIPASMVDSEKFAGTMVAVTINMADENQAAETARLLQVSEVAVQLSGTQLAISGDMSRILKNTLIDSELMFNNNGTKVQEKYGYDGHKVLFNWWNTFRVIGTELTNQKKFAEAKPFADIRKKALEPAYNYYGIEAMQWKDNIGLIIAALTFYVAYTLWYGFGLMFVFEGFGLKIGH